jgi:hypothetical protein
VKGTGYPTPFAIFPFISPPVRHRVPSHFIWTLRPVIPADYGVFDIGDLSRLQEIFLYSSWAKPL